MKMLWLLVGWMLLATPAWAQETAVHASASDDEFVRIGVGARVGGYGFRQVNEDGNLDFEACRMNGTGVFGTVDVGEHGYAELAADFYHAVAEPTRNGIDRLSLHTTLAGGIKFFPDSFVTPIVFAGGGVEFSHAKLYGIEQSVVAPVAFVGAGGELNFGDLKAGMSIRSNAMALPEYDWVEGDRVTWTTEVAGQGLFWLRYVL